MEINEFRMMVTKKMLFTIAYQAKIESHKARIEYLKAQGAASIFFEECASQLAWLSSSLMELADADDEGNPLRAKCPECGHKLFDGKDVYGKDAMVYHCFYGALYKIEKKPGGMDLTPDQEAIFNREGGDKQADNQKAGRG